MKIARPKTESYHNYDDDVARPKPNFHKKGFWKRYDRKKFFRNLLRIKD